MRRKRRKYKSSEIEDANPLILIGFEGRKKSLLLSKDYNALEKLLQDLLQEIANRINSKNFNSKIDELILKTSILFDDLKRHKSISNKSFKVIALLPTINQLGTVKK